MDDADHLLNMLAHAYGAQSNASISSSTTIKNASLTRVSSSQCSTYEQLLLATRDIGQELLTVLSSKVVLERVLNQLPFGLFMVSADLRVLALNKFAQALVDSGTGFAVIKRRLACMDGRSHQRLEHHLHRVAALKGEQVRFALRVARGPDQSDLQISITGVDLPTALDGSQEWPAACIWVFDPGAHRVLTIDLVRDLHGLTSTQAEVAAALYRGLSVEDTAVELDVSIHTIKTHLKHIFQKCEVRSQAELLQMLSLGPK